MSANADHGYVAIGEKAEGAAASAQGYENEHADAMFRADNAIHGKFESLMHRIQSPALRAVALYWHEARGRKRMPSWAELPAIALKPYFPVLWGVQYDPNTGELTGRLSGDRFDRWVGPDFQGVRLKDIYSRSTYRDAKHHLTRIAATPLAARSSGRLFTVKDFVVTGERIGLPMSEDGKTGDGIFGASDYWPPPLSGPWELVHENMEWYEI